MSKRNWWLTLAPALLISGLITCSSTSEAKEGSDPMDAAQATKIRERTEVDKKDKWRLEDIFKTQADWEQAYADLEKAIPTIRDWEGKLCDSAETLKMVFDKMDSLSETFRRVGAYASLQTCLNTRDNKALALLGRVRNLGVKFSQAVAWINPEILAQAPAKLEAFCQDPLLKTYHHDLNNLLRMKEHVLDREKENILSQLGMVTGASGTIYNTFTDAEFPDPQIKLKSGVQVTLTKPNYGKCRASTVRQDRKNTFEAFWKVYMSFKNTLASTYAARLNADNFSRKVRKYDSCLEGALYGNNLPVKLYTNLIDRIHQNLPSFHRYLKLRKKLLNVDTLYYYDIYAPIIKPGKLTYPWDQARQLCCAAVKPLGPDYCKVFAAGLNEKNRWVDVYPTKAKRSGAFSAGVYGVHPFVLMNYNGTYDSVTTLAHEMGHALHSYLANHAQPHNNAGYATFVAEVASTFNESLLTEMMLKQAKDDREKLYILGQWLDNYRQTVFRQAMFAEFEWRAHQLVEQGKPITAETLNELYLKLLRLYHGHDEGIMDIQDLYAIEWAFIPHFYRSFYVFTYATGLISSTALAAKVLEEGEGASNAYLEALSLGGSTYPLEILKRAGADLMTPEPYNKANQVFAKRLELAEEIVKRLEAQGKL